MKANRELAFVGTFIAVAVGILLFTMLYISGAFRGSGNLYRAYFKNAGGLQVGGTVRYAAGPPVGRVTNVEPDPQDPTRMLIEFRVEKQVPVKTDSPVKIDSLSELGDNFLSILPGTPNAPRALDGATLPIGKFNTFEDLETNLSTAIPKAQTTINDLNKEADKLQKAIGHLNTQLNAQNREKISKTITKSNNMLASTRRTIPPTLKRMDESTAKLDRFLRDFKKTLKKTDDAVTHLDKTIVKKNPEILATLQKLHQNLDAASELIDRFDRKLSNTDVDGIVDNMRQISQNLKDLTETIKTQPNSLLRSSEPKPRKPGQAPPR